MWWFWLLGWLLTIVTVIGNGTVISLIIGIHRLHNTANWLVLALAFADLFVGLTFFPLLFAMKIDSLNDPDHENVDPFFLVSRTFLYFSATNLFVMIVDRYFAIVHPLRYLSIMSPKVIKIAITMAWILPAALFTLPRGLHVRNRYLLVFRVFVFQVVTAIVFVFVACRIFCILRKISERRSKIFAQLRFNHAPKYSPTVLRSSKESKAAAKMTMAIMFLFIICYVFENYKCVCFVFELCETTASLDIAIDLLFLINSASNPIVYAFLKRDVRAAFQSLLARRKVHVQNISTGREMTSSTPS
ncbi:histamine H2 receptor-like [Pocillopora damicornis]|uniref:histamine H2 receptor-like n=1 Tax=Pocillopora damicornis TaxID=46731 RepID=UPI000F5553E5|nr:histamine H2 receptor-like [Pocillopora damicornis]